MESSSGSMLQPASHKEKWENLPEDPLVESVYPSANPLTGSIMSKSPIALHNLVKIKAKRYMDSKPGPDNAGSNTDCHPRFYKLLEGSQLEFDELCRLNEILDYRQGQMRLVEIYCHALEIGVPEGRQTDQFDEFIWEGSLLKARRERSTESSKVATDLLEKFYTTRGWVIQLGIFDSPLPQQGFHYPKPKAYLAARLAESPMSTQQIYKKLEDLLQYKLEEARLSTRSPPGEAVLIQPEI